ncbi:STAS domain-containing protein [Amycolatopsis mediterranei]|uniref:STAS domain-containing protein n=1 Tax=Amycolatopsis mediterranei TaxID=33910 RepID=UPI00343BFF3E
MSTITDPHENEVPRFEAPAGTVDVLTVRAPAELDDADTAAQLLVPAAASPRGTAVVVDLSAVTYLTTEAVIPLVTLARQCLGEGRELRVVASASARQKLTLLGLNTVLSLHPPA